MRNPISVGAILIAAMFACSLLVPFANAITIEDEDSNSILAYVLWRQGESFEIQYIHSIHLSPVIESYHVHKRQIIQDRLTYKEFAVGMPSNSEGDEQFTKRDGAYMLTNMNRSFPYLDIRIAQVMPDHGMLIRSRFIPFAQVAEPGSWIRLKIRRLALWQMIKGVDLLERHNIE